MANFSVQSFVLGSKFLFFLQPNTLYLTLATDSELKPKSEIYTYNKNWNRGRLEKAQRGASKTSHKDKGNLWRRQERALRENNNTRRRRSRRTKDPEAGKSRKIRLTIFHSWLQRQFQQKQRICFGIWLVFAHRVSHNLQLARYSLKLWPRPLARMSPLSLNDA